MKVIIDRKYKWQEYGDEEQKYWHIGSEKAAKKFAYFCRLYSKASIKELGEELKNIAGNFAVLVRQRERLIVAVDKIRSYPIFYVHEGDRFAVSNSARTLKDECSLSEIDELSLLEFRMAGYVTGRETLYKDLYQLQAGEFIVWDEKDRRLEQNRYYLFYSENVRQEKEGDLIEELDEVTNKIFYRVTEEAKGAPIWVPLSGGLDSRLVLCKLKQLGYDHLISFSYGPPGNYEAKAAKHVAEKLGVPWHFVPSKRKEAKTFFWSEERKKYWDFADGLHIAPNIHWVDSIKLFLRKGLVSENAIFINGQSGDFVQGEHIPKVDKNEIDIAELCNKIIQKHFSLLKPYLNERNYVNRVNCKIVKTITSCAELNINDYQDFAKYYELWEWQERQCKRVINGQRIYDFYGLSWELPLWADEYLYYWESIPLKYKFERYLFRRYLEKKDFYGLFKKYKPIQSRWPGKLIFIQFIGNGVKILFGEKLSRKYYQYLDYFSHYSNFYAPFSYLEYIRVCQNYKGALPFFGQIWENEYLNGQ